MNKQQATQILNSRVLVKEPAKYTVKVTSVNPHMREDGTMVTIVNFGAITPYQAELATKAFNEGKYEEAVGKGTSLSTSQLSGQFVPSKGETVDIEVEEIYSDKAEANILVVSSIVARKAIKATRFSIGIEESVEEPEIA